MAVLLRARLVVRSHHAWVALALYLGIVAALELPVLAHLNSRCACFGEPSDPTQYMWAMVWWPHAILHGLNPFLTDSLVAGRQGLDLASATATPAEALLAWPLTALAGPLVAYNIVAMLAPVSAAWFAYRLCLHVTRHPAASIVGGYLFGFSSYEWGQTLGHQHLTVIFAIPWAILLTLKRLDRVITARRYVPLLALLLTFQLLTSTEVLFTFALASVLALACALAVSNGEERRRIASLLPELTTGCILMAVICSPYLYYALSGPAVTGGPISADLLNFLFPSRITALGGHWFSAVSQAYPGGLAEAGTYLGLPLIGIVASYLVRTWSSRGTRFLAGALASLVIWALGDHLYVDGHSTVRLPWVVVWHALGFKQVITVRIAVYIALTCAVIAAMWLAASYPRPLVTWGCALLAIVALFPSIDATAPGTRSSLFHSRISTPRFFTGGGYRRYLTREEVILALPFGHARYGWSLLWQARADMYFRMVNGSFGYVPPSYPEPLVRELLGHEPLSPDTPSSLRSFMVAQGVSAVVADPRYSQPWLPVLAKLGLRPVAAGGVLVYRIPDWWRNTAPR